MDPVDDERLPSLDPNASLVNKQQSRQRRKWEKLQSIDVSESSTEELQKKLRENQEQAEAADEIFNRHDLNHDDQLTHLELIECLEDMGLRQLFPGEQFMRKVKECMAKFDKDHSGSIDRNEFLIFYNWLVLDRRQSKRSKKSKKDKKRSRRNKSVDFGKEGDPIEQAERQQSRDRPTTADALGHAAAAAAAGDAALEEKGGERIQKRKRSRKKESRKKEVESESDKAAIKQHVKSALAAVRDVLETDKGQQILKIETQVRRAKKDKQYIDVEVKRETPTGTLGLSFVIPPRIMAIGWASGQFVVVSGGAKIADHALEVGDVVIACDKMKVATIKDLQEATKGKTEMVFKCVRMPNVSDQDLTDTKQKIEKSLKSAVKAKVKEQLAQRSSRNKSSSQQAED